MLIATYAILNLRDHLEDQRKMDVRVGDYEQLSLIAWNRDNDLIIDGSQALKIYEANWEYVHVKSLTNEEKELIDKLAEIYGGGVLCV